MPPVAPLLEDAFPVRLRGRGRVSDHGTGQRRSDFPWLRLCLGSGAVLAGLVVLARPPEPVPTDVFDRPPVEPALVSAPPPTWEPVAGPAAAFAVAAPDLQDLPFTYEARREREGAREDILTFGAAEEYAQRYIRIVVHQAGQPGSDQPRFFVDLARRAADAGLAVTRSAPAGSVSTKFGPVEAADVVLSGRADRACLAFRLSRPDAGLRVGGWLCSAGGEPPSRRGLACLVDGLSLRSTENAALSALFAEVERLRDASCAPVARVAEAPRPAPPSRNARRR